MPPVRLSIDQIGFDFKFYPRVNGADTPKKDWITVLRYKEALLTHPQKSNYHNSGSFPPVTVVRSHGYSFPYVLIDGLYRIHAFMDAGYTHIWCIIERIPKSKWLERAVELNVVSKRALDSGDKRWIAKQLESFGYRPERIAGLLQMTPESFERLISRNIEKLTSTAGNTIPVGRGNREIGTDGERFGFLKSPLEAITGTAEALQGLLHQGSITSTTSSQIIGSFIGLLEARAVDMDNEEIVEQLERARDLLEDLLS